MPSVSDWKVPAEDQPKPSDYGYDLATAVASVVGVRAEIPDDAFTAQTLGTERAGNGVLIRDSGLVLTIGYLITEAEAIWLTPLTGPAVPGHALAYDQETGFGLIQALSRLNARPLPIGNSSHTSVGERVVVAGSGGLQRSVAARIVAKQEFAGYWEYVLDEAIFTAPSHPNWGGTAVIGPRGELIGIGSLQLEQGREKDGDDGHLNMIVPIDLLEPIIDDLLRHGRPNRPARPWLGFYAAEIENRIVIIGVADRGPAQKAGLQAGDVVHSVAGHEPTTLASLFRHIWSLGTAGVVVPLRIYRDGRSFEQKVVSSERSRFFKVPRMH
jgi:S1-C subfamily serine protease